MEPGSDEIDDGVEVALRPSLLDDFEGQPKATTLLKMAVAGARERGEAPDHALIYGPPGLGKTTLASILARETGGGFKTIMGPSVNRPADLASVLVSIKAGDVLFVDEVHRLPPAASELLYGAMEDFRLDIVSDDGRGSGAISIPLPRFCLIGATTRPGMLQKPFKDRFGLVVSLVPYDDQSMRSIVSRSAGILGMKLAQGVEGEVARRSRGTPRLGNSFLRRLRDHAAYQRMDVVTIDMAEDAFGLLGIDSEGLNDDDHRYLDALGGRFKDRPVGLKALSAVLGMDADAIENDIEPWLLRKGMVERSPRGRILPAVQNLLDI